MKKYESIRYSEDELKAIVEALGPTPKSKFSLEVWSEDSSKQIEVNFNLKEALSYRLDNAVAVLFFDVEINEQPTKLRRAKSFEQIEKAAQRLIEALQVTNDEDIPGWVWGGGLGPYYNNKAERLGGLPVYSPKGLFKQSIEGLTDIKSAAEEAKRNYSDVEPMDRKKRRQGDLEIHAFVDRLIEIWMEMKEEPLPSYSTRNLPEGDIPTGGLINFLEACMEPIEEIKKVPKKTLKHWIYEKRKTLDLINSSRRGSKK